MRQFLTAIAVVTLLISAAHAAEKRQILVDGKPRSYLIERATTPGPSPTIIVLHGAFGTSESAARATRLHELAPSQGFAAVFPQSAAPLWNRWVPGKEPTVIVDWFRKYGGIPNDVGYLRMLVADLVQRGDADPKRIYLAGISNGGFTTLDMFCRDEGRLFAGIGLSITSMTEEIGENCRPPKPLPIVMVLGTLDDPFYRGGLLGPSPGLPTPSKGSKTSTVWSAERLTSYFHKLNGCDGQPERSVLHVKGTQINVDRSSRCSGGTVLAYHVVGGTHRSTTQILEDGRVMLEFFRDGTGAKAGPPPAAAPKGKPAPPPPATTKPKIAAKSGGFNFIAYRRTDGKQLVTGALRRTSGNEWTEVNTQGANWTFRSTEETDAEIIFHDVSRDVYLRADLALKALFMRQGTRAWEQHSEIVRADR